jgi:hypothetical protein
MRALRFRFDREYAIQRAVASADDSGLTSEVVQQDVDDLKRAGSLVELVRHRQEMARGERFNAQRVRDVFSDDPEFETLMSIAQDGAIIDTPSGFVKQSVTEPLRPLNIRLERCMRQHALKLRNKGRGVFLSEDSLSEADRLLLNKQSAHWVLKPAPDGRSNIDEGRALIDPKGLNAGDAKEKVKQRYGPLRLATFSSIVTGWYEHAREHNLKMSDCRIFKDDVEGAFPQFNFNPTSALLLVILVSVGLLLMHVVGNFGWTGAPFVWGVISRALERKAKTLFVGVLDVYVDDFVGFAHFSVAVAAQQLVQELIKRALGDTAVNIQKSIPPTTECDVLGWTVCLVSETFCPNLRGCAKLLFAFFSVDTSRDQPRKMFEVLAGLANRYSEGIPEMKPYVSAFFAMEQACGTHSNVRKRMSSRAKFCVEMWRVVALMLWYDSNSLRKPLISVTHLSSVKPDFYLWSDASPWKLAAILYDEGGKEIAHATHNCVF